MTQNGLPHLQICSGLSRFCGDADADVRAALAGGHDGRGRIGVTWGVLGGQHVSLPPEISLVDLHGLARGLRAVFQVVPASEQKLGLLTVCAGRTGRFLTIRKTRTRGQKAAKRARGRRTYLLGLDAVALQQLIQSTEESTGAGDGGVASFNAPLHARLCHPVHHAAGQDTRTSQTSLCDPEAPPPPPPPSQFQEVQVRFPL